MPVEIPIAVTNSDITTTAGVEVTLDASDSTDPQGKTITVYEWSLLSAPPGSSAVMDNAFTKKTKFTPDITGSYRFFLKVETEDGRSSESDYTRAPASAFVHVRILTGRRAWTIPAKYERDWEDDLWKILTRIDGYVDEGEDITRISMSGDEGIVPIGDGSGNIVKRFITDTDIVGGYATVLDEVARDAIPTNRRRVGMMVSIADGTRYQLVGGTTNSHWDLIDDKGAWPKRFVFRPKSTSTIGNVYNDWTSLYNDLLVAEGNKEVIFDGSELSNDEFITIPTGTYNLSGVHLHTAGHTYTNRVGQESGQDLYFEGVPIQFESGAVFTNVASMQNLVLIPPASGSAPIQWSWTGPVVSLDRVSTMTPTDGATTTPVFWVRSSADFTLEVRSGKLSAFAVGNPILTVDGTLDLHLHDRTTVEPGTISGSGTISYLIGPTTDWSDQVLFTGTASTTWSASPKYIDASGTWVNSTNPEDLDDLLHDLDSAISTALQDVQSTVITLNTDGPISVGDVVYISSDDTVSIAKADTYDTAIVTGLVQSIPISGTARVVVAGKVTSLSEISPGQRYWLSAITGGEIVTSPPSGSGQIITQVGLGLSPNTLLLQIQPPVENP